MTKQIDLLFVPDGCSPECPILHTAQIAALTMVAESQSLFQGFLKCLDKMQPTFHLDPNETKGASMVEYFTQRLDGTLVGLFHEGGALCHRLNCTSCAFRDTCPSQQASDQSSDGSLSESAVVERMELVDKSLYENAVGYNAQLQSHCQELEEQVEKLLGELAKRRTQYDNRILIQIFEDQYNANLSEEEQGSFFDIVPRERLQDFIPFVRNIVLGPAIAKKFDEQVEMVIEQYKDEHGHIPVGRWEAVLDDAKIRRIMDRTSAILYERSQHKESFHMLIRRKSPVSLQKQGELIRLFQSLGVQHELDLTG